MVEQIYDNTLIHRLGFYSISNLTINKGNKKMNTYRLTIVDKTLHSQTLEVQGINRLDAEAQAPEGSTVERCLNVTSAAAARKKCYAGAR